VARGMADREAGEESKPRPCREGEKDERWVTECQVHHEPFYLCQQVAALKAQVETLERANAKLKGALSTAWATIHALHGYVGWNEYQHSPEMKEINAALGGGK
jgi:hypothetical protein